MKILQFQQDKTSLSWLTASVTFSLSEIFNTVTKIRATHPVTWRQIYKWKVAQELAKLIIEYYSILFSQDTFASDIWKDWKISNLERLFPTAEPIYIDQDTNFLVLPLPLPTFKQYTHQNLYRYLPFLAPYSSNNSTSEWIRDMDFQVDNPYITNPVKYDMRNISKWYVHTDPRIKLTHITEPADNESRLRVYSYRDINSASLKNISVPYSLSILDPMNVKWYTQRQVTLLEITSYKTNADSFQNQHLSNNHNNKPIRLKSYSMNYLEPLAINPNHFTYQLNSANPNTVEWFVDYWRNQFSIPEVKWAIKQLKNYIKYNFTFNN